jgi:hypothetical protein
MLPHRLDRRMSSWVAPAVVVAVVLLVFYQRYKRTFGAQRVRPVGIVLRGVLLFLLAWVACFAAWTTSLRSVAGIVLGSAIGAGLAAYSLKTTRFSVTPEGKFYETTPYVGVTITALVLARMAWRFSVTGGGLFTRTATGIHSDGSSAVTMAFLFVLFVYYWIFFGGVLWSTRDLAVPAA